MGCPAFLLQDIDHRKKQFPECGLRELFLARTGVRYGKMNDGMGKRIEALEQEVREARDIARLLWEWCLWHDHLTTALCNAETMEEVEALRVGCLEKYEEWRRVRESGMRHRHPWIKGASG